MTYLSQHDKADELAAAEADYIDRLHEAQEGFCVSRGPEYRTTIRELKATLQAKDATIAALVELMKEARNYLVHELPECECHQFKNGVFYDCIQCRLQAAIKEATDAS